MRQLSTSSTLRGFKSLLINAEGSVAREVDGKNIFKKVLDVLNINLSILVVVALLAVVFKSAI
jgi:hypothetical protein